MKWTLRFFAFLDLICMILLAEQASDQYSSFSANESLTSLQFFSRFAFLLGWISLLFTTLFLAIPRKIGIVIYYFQLPFRLVFFIFSFGFISLLSYWITIDNLNQIIVSIAVFGELLRLYYSWQIQKSYF